MGAVFGVAGGFESPAFGVGELCPSAKYDDITQEVVCCARKRVLRRGNGYNGTIQKEK